MSNFIQGFSTGQLVTEELFASIISSGVKDGWTGEYTFTSEIIDGLDIRMIKIVNFGCVIAGTFYRADDVLKVELPYDSVRTGGVPMYEVYLDFNIVTKEITSGYFRQDDGPFDHVPPLPNNVRLTLGWTHGIGVYRDGILYSSNEFQLIVAIYDGYKNNTSRVIDEKFLNYINFNIIWSNINDLPHQEVIAIDTVSSLNGNIIANPIYRKIQYEMEITLRKDSLTFVPKIHFYDTSYGTKMKVYAVLGIKE